jgi:hypothetical protein
MEKTIGKITAVVMIAIGKSANMLYLRHKCVETTAKAATVKDFALRKKDNLLNTVTSEAS